MDGPTRTVCYHSPSLYLLLTLLLDQSQECVVRTPRLERAYALQVLAFEMKADLWVCRGLAFEWGPDEGFWGLRGRGDLVEGLAGEERGEVDVWFYEVVGFVDGSRC